MPDKGKVNDVIGSIEFKRFFDRIPQNDPRKKEFYEAFKILKDCLLGDKIPHDRWSVSYINKYRIKNLWRYTLRSGWRIIYTVSSQKEGFIVCILEAFPHKDYEKRFGY